MVKKLGLTDKLITDANAFLKGKETKKPDAFVKDPAGETALVDKYDDDATDAKSWLREVSDGTIGVRTLSTDNGKNTSSERALFSNGKVYTQTCPEISTVSTDCTVAEIGKYDLVRVAAFFAATFGFSALHEGDPKLGKDGNPVLDKDKHPIYAEPGQMTVLRRKGGAAVRALLDEALVQFGGYAPTADALRITKDLRETVNAYLGFDFIEEKHIGSLLVRKNPEAKNASFLTGADENGRPGTGVIGIVYAGSVTLRGATIPDGRVEKALYHDGKVYEMHYDNQYNNAESANGLDEAGNANPVKTVDPLKAIGLTAGLFGFATLYDTQLIENFPESGPTEQQAREALDRALDTFTFFRTQPSTALSKESAMKMAADADASTKEKAAADVAKATKPAVVAKAPDEKTSNSEDDASPEPPPAKTSPSRVSIMNWFMKKTGINDYTQHGVLRNFVANVMLPALSVTAIQQTILSRIVGARLRSALRENLAAGGILPKVEGRVIAAGFDRVLAGRAGAPLHRELAAVVLDGAGLLRTEFSAFSRGIRGAVAKFSILATLASAALAYIPVFSADEKSESNEQPSAMLGRMLQAALPESATPTASTQQSDLGPIETPTDVREL